MGPASFGTALRTKTGARIVAVDERGEEHESEPRMGGTANNVRLQVRDSPACPSPASGRSTSRAALSITRSNSATSRCTPASKTRCGCISTVFVTCRRRQAPLSVSIRQNLSLLKSVGPKSVQAKRARIDRRQQTTKFSERILANWRARQDRTKSFRYAWNTRFVVRFQRRTWVQHLRRALWVAGDDRFRFEQAAIDGRRNWRVNNAARSTCVRRLDANRFGMAPRFVGHASRRNSSAQRDARF